MKILNFKVVGVRGFLTKNISFRDNVTFLVGINGSGKTTILELMYGLLNPDLKSLFTIDYKEISLICELGAKSKFKKKTIQVISKKQDDNFVIAYRDANASIYETFSFPIIHSIDLYETEWNSAFSEIDINFSKSSVWSLIKQLSTPVILNLNRFLPSFTDFDVPFRMSHSESLRKTHMKNDDISRALFYVQELVYWNIRRTARQQNKLAEDFKNKVFEEMFTSPQEIGFNFFSQKSVESSKISDLRETLKSVGSLDEETGKLTQKVDRYLADYEQTLEKYLASRQGEKKGKMNDVEFKLLQKMLVYDLQYDKIIKIAEFARDNMIEVKKLHDPLDRFVESVNLFFKEGNKEIRLAGNGDILVINHNKGANVHDSIFNLSSGEKQLVILMACLSLPEQSKLSRVYVVDEPEVSLHITWQEQFVDALLKASPDTQFILATHSPSIIAKTERRNWCEDLTMI